MTPARTTEAGLEVDTEAGREIGGVRPDGLAILGPRQVALRDEVEAGIAEWIRDFGAVEVELPRLVGLADAAGIDYFQHFPQLGLVVSGLADPAEMTRRAASGPVAVGPSDLAEPAHLLPSAACYGLYFALRGARVPEISLYTFEGHCFRREASYDGLDRLLGFTMREVVAVGTYDAVEEFVGRGRDVLRHGANRFGIPAELVVATDPFFEPDGHHATMQKLLPTKQELVSARGVALGSANFHRTFYGERCDIRLAATGEPATTGCVGFGIERWIGELTHVRGER